MESAAKTEYGARVALLRTVTMTVACVCIAGPAPGGDFEPALERAQQAAREHRYQDAIELLTPFNSDPDPEVQYITAAEIGRAHFHLGQYRTAHRAFRQAVTLRPRRAETAVYLQATSFLIGDRVQALMIFEQLLMSGARDLYLAVTLPGERRFLTDPGVLTLLERHAVALELNPDRGTFNRVAVGASRDDVASAFEMPVSQSSGRVLSASAGTATMWAFIFDADDRVEKIVVDVDHMTRYTPYRIRLAGHPEWLPTPAATVSALGPPTESRVEDESLFSVWALDGCRMSFEFRQPRRPYPVRIPEGSASLQVLQITSPAVKKPDRMPP